MDTKKFCACVRQYEDDLYILALAILRHEADAEDAVSNAILQAYEHVGQLRSDQKFRPWILMITRNEALKLKKKRLYLPGDDAVEALAKPVQVQYDELWDVLQQMQEEYRVAVVLFYYEDLPLREIANVLEVPVGTVKSRLSRGKAQLREMLERGHM